MSQNRKHFRRTRAFVRRHRGVILVGGAATMAILSMKGDIKALENELEAERNKTITLELTES